MLLGLDGKAVTTKLIAAELETLDAVYRKRKRALRALLVLLEDEAGGRLTIADGATVGISGEAVE